MSDPAFGDIECGAHQLLQMLLSMRGITFLQPPNELMYTDTRIELWTKAVGECISTVSHHCAPTEVECLYAVIVEFEDKYVRTVEAGVIDLTTDNTMSVSEYVQSSSADRYWRDYLDRRESHLQCNNTDDSRWISAVLVVASTEDPEGRFHQTPKMLRDRNHTNLPDTPRLAINLH